VPERFTHRRDALSGKASADQLRGHGPTISAERPALGFLSEAFVSQTGWVDRHQQLSVVGRLFPAILDGSKTSTVRWNESPILPGVMKYVSDVPPHSSVDVMVTVCTSMPLSEAAAFLGRGTEWPATVMLTGMREHYADIELTDRVDVIEHLTPQKTKDRARAGADPGCR